MKFVPVKERFARLSVPVTESGCWLWLGACNKKGYGRIQIGRSSKQAHRVSFELFRGPLVPGKMIDHLCRVRCCVNPEHLRLVTPFVNSIENSRGPAAINLRKTQCIHGHSLTDALLRIRPNGRVNRDCRTCKELQWQRRKAVLCR